MGNLRGLAEKKHRTGTLFITLLFLLIFMRMTWTGVIRMRAGFIGMKENETQGKPLRLTAQRKELGSIWKENTS